MSVILTFFCGIVVVLIGAAGILVSQAPWMLAIYLPGASYLVTCAIFHAAGVRVVK